MVNRVTTSYLKREDNSNTMYTETDNSNTMYTVVVSLCMYELFVCIHLQLVLQGFDPAFNSSKRGSDLRSKRLQYLKDSLNGSFDVRILIAWLHV